MNLEEYDLEILLKYVVGIERSSELWEKWLDNGAGRYKVTGAFKKMAWRGSWGMSRAIYRLREK